MEEPSKLQAAKSHVKHGFLYIIPKTSMSSFDPLLLNLLRDCPLEKVGYPNCVHNFLRDANRVPLINQPTSPFFRMGKKTVDPYYSPRDNIVVLGEGGVGKSTLTIQFLHKIFVEEYDPGIEDSYVRQIEIENETRILDILDTGGREDYPVIREYQIKNGHGFLVLYSITSRSSFEILDSKFLQILQEKKAGHPQILVATKSDLASEREVSEDEGKVKAKKYGMKYFETSAKKNLNVTEVFLEISRSIKIWKESNPKWKEHCAKNQYRSKCVIL